MIEGLQIAVSRMMVDQQREQFDAPLENPLDFEPQQPQVQPVHASEFLQENEWGAESDDSGFKMV
eukprot:Pgem_evm1s11655